MKRMFCTIALFCLLGTALPAQYIGGGLSLAGIASQIDGDQWGGYKKIGYHIGGWATYDFNDWLAMQIEILHSHRGSREVVKDFGQVSLNFIDVPVLLRIRPLQNLPREAWVEVGPSVHYLLSAKTGFNNLKVDQSDNYRRVSGELGLGMGTFLTDHIAFFGRWNIGVTNLSRFVRPWFTIHYFSFGFKFGMQ
ncbi:MAG: porin family protein [Bacteroidota bacterium]